MDTWNRLPAARGEVGEGIGWRKMGGISQRTDGMHKPLTRTTVCWGPEGRRGGAECKRKENWEVYKSGNNKKVKKIQEKI